MSDLLQGLSTYKDECLDAAHGLDARRKEHERRHRRHRLVSRPATKAVMIDFVRDFGATELVHSDDLRHVPVVPVADGVAFDPARMTMNVLVEVYEKLHKVKRPEGRVYNRVAAVVQSYQGGLREKEIVEITGVSRSGVKKALYALEFDGEIRVTQEATRPGGTPRKRYWPAAADPLNVSLSPALAAGVV